MFPHHKLRVEVGREYSPLLLEMFPEAKEYICEYTTKNIEMLSCEKVAIYVRNILAKKSCNQYKEETENRELTFDRFKLSMKIIEFGVTTAWRYVRYMGFKFDEHEKTYFNDQHENEENIRYRKKFMK